jgi:hypothetical protein
MGPKSDSQAVVDSHARVHGVSGVRVVDASAFPFLPPGHPQSTICKYSTPAGFQNELWLTIVDALAEKIANDIKNGN